jgi:acetyl esterase/lipase
MKRYRFLIGVFIFSVFPLCNITAGIPTDPGGREQLPDTLQSELTAFRQWAIKRIPGLKQLEGKVNTAVIPTEKTGEWWQKRHARKLEEVRGPKKNTRLVFLGNSITHQLEEEGNKEIWEKFFGEYDYLNLGVSGDRTENVLWRILHGEIDGIHPDLLVLLIGTNNTDGVHYPKADSGSEVAEGIARICYEVRRKLPDTKILIQAIFPFGEDPSNVRRAANREASRLAAQLADGEHIFFTDLNDRFLNPDGTIDPAIMPDYLHPSPAGNWIWAKSLSPVVDGIMAGVYVPVSSLPDSVPLKVRYRKIDSTELFLHMWYPPDYDPAQKYPAIIFFFGGGWIGGGPTQFTEQAKYFARRGMIAMTADYRVKKRNNTTPFDAVRDAKSAIRFLRQYAGILGVDPQKIVASGGSAGGHLAAAAGIIKGLEPPGEDTAISSRPDALVLFNPVFDNGPGGYGYDRVGERYREISPFHNIAPGDPPTILFFGTKDKYVPVATIKAFQKKMQDAGNRCDLFLYEGQGHGFFNSWKPEYYEKTMREADKFLVSLGFLKEIIR